MQPCVSPRCFLIAGCGERDITEAAAPFHRAYDTPQTQQYNADIVKDDLNII